MKREYLLLAVLALLGIIWLNWPVEEEPPIAQFSHEKIQDEPRVTLGTLLAGEDQSRQPEPSFRQEY